jgi:hypothetical protein
MERRKGQRRPSGSKKGSGGRVIRDRNVEPTIYRKAMEEKVTAFERRTGWINTTGPNGNEGSMWVNSHRHNRRECWGGSTATNLTMENVEVD